MNKEFEKEVIRRFDTVIKLLTISSMKDETQIQKIILLNSAGFSPKEIADILGTTRNTVSVALTKLKKKDSKEKESIKDEGASENENDKQ